jgi:hypothetical protein
MNSGLSMTQVQSLAISPNYASDSTVFVSLFFNQGVYKSTDGGESWTQMNNGLSEETVLSIAISPNYANDPTVFAGTLDGVFSYTGFGTGVTALILPNGGDVIPSGGIYGICWEAPLEAVKFNLYYSLNNRAPWNFIKTVTGMYCIHWDVPVVTANKKKCRVKVIGYDSVGIPVGEGISDQPFAIEVLRVTSPNGGETLESGDISTIQWTTHKTIRSVAKAVLKYTTDGSTWKKIKTLTGNPVSFNWKVPAVSSAKCKVKIILKDASGINIGTDVSDKVFTIQP